MVKSSNNENFKVPTKGSLTRKEEDRHWKEISRMKHIQKEADQKETSSSRRMLKGKNWNFHIFPSLVLASKDKRISTLEKLIRGVSLKMLRYKRVARHIFKRLTKRTNLSRQKVHTLKMQARLWSKSKAITIGVTSNTLWTIATS